MRDLDMLAVGFVAYGLAFLIIAAIVGLAMSGAATVGAFIASLIA